MAKIAIPEGIPEDVKKIISPIIEAANSDFDKMAAQIAKAEEIKADIVKQRDEIKAKQKEAADRIADLEAKVGSAETVKLETAGKYQEALALKESEWKKKFEEQNGNLAKLQEMQKRGAIESEIRAAMSEAGVLSETKALPFIKTVFDFDAVEDNGRLVGKVLKGENVLNADGTTKGIKQAVKDFLTNGKNDEFLKPTGERGGAGANGAGAGFGAGHVFTKAEIKGMSREEFEKNEKEIDKQLSEGKIV